MSSSLQNQAAFTGVAIRSALGRVEYRWFTALQLVGGVMFLSVLFGGSVVGVENTWPESITYALSGWVPALTALTVVAGLSGLSSRPTLSLLPRFKRQRGHAVLGCAALAVAVAAGASASLSVLTPIAAGSIALAAFTCGTGVLLGQGAWRAAWLTAFFLLHVALTRGSLDAVALSHWKPLVVAVPCGSFLFYRVRSVWPQGSSDKGSGHAASSLGFPAPRSLDRSGLSSAARLREAGQFRSTAMAEGARWKPFLNLLAILMAPGLFILAMSALGLFEDSSLGVAERIYRDFVTDVGPDGVTPSTWSEASAIALPLLIFSSVFALSQHSVLGSVLVSRGTMARVALRGYLKAVVFATVATCLGVFALTALVASMTGFGWPDRVPPIFVSLTLLIGLLPWVALLTLAVQRAAPMGAAGSESSAPMLQTFRGFFAALVVGMPAYQLGVRFLQTKVLTEPTVLSVLPITLVSVAVGAAFLPSAFRRYYDRVSLER